MTRMYNTQNLTENNPRFALEAMPTANLSDKYQFISTQDIVSACCRMGLTIKTEAACRTRIVEKRGYQKHSVIMGETTDMAIPKIGDCSLRVIITNDHSGGGSIKVQIGLYRMVCTNGMVVGQDLMKPLRFRHVKRQVEGQELQDYIIGRVQDLLSDFYTNVQGRVATMRDVILTAEQQTTFATEAAKLLSNNGVSNLVSDAQLLMVNRQADMSNDLWTVFNRIQENGMRGGLDRQVAQGRRRNHATTRPIRGMARAHAFNEDLFDLAVSYLPKAA